MAELADAPDLGSGTSVCRFNSCYPHHQEAIKKDIARGNPDFIGVSTVLYGKILATDFVDVNRSFSLYIRF